MHRLRTGVRGLLDSALLGRGLQLIPASPSALVRVVGESEIELRGVRINLAEAWVSPNLLDVLQAGLYEAPEADIIEATMAPTDRVLEIGCGIGFIATIASRIVRGNVRCYDANPAMVAAARRTLRRNGNDAVVTNAVLQYQPIANAGRFYVHSDFWTSSTAYDPAATQISVPVMSLEQEIDSHEASYLIIDIEGDESALLAGRLPSCVRKLCVECHPMMLSPAAVTGVVASLLSQGFLLRLEHCRSPVLYFER